ncbi:MAG TPA: hypothetical protein VJ438_05880 [Candidatus Nanoarchaeia archaeon]|nr:hypothetical protein [Candidatus Nanoarchaeia archaeon]
MYYHRETYERIVRTGRLIPIKSKDLKNLNGVSTKRLLEMKVLSEVAFVCDTRFSDRDLLMIIKVHSPLDAKGYSSFRYSGETNNTCVVKFY